MRRESRFIETERFESWLKADAAYSDAVIGDTVSRVKRADSILEWDDDEIYQFYLEHNENDQSLSVSVRSQIKKAERHIGLIVWFKPIVNGRIFDKPERPLEFRPISRIINSRYRPYKRDGKRDA